MLLNHIKSKKDIDIGFRAISSSDIAMQQDNTFTWKLAARSSPEVPRYLLLAFQTGKSGNQEQNPALFDNLNLTNLRVQLNEKQYPSTEYTAHFGEHKFSRIYMDAMAFKNKFYEVQSTEKEITSASGMNPIEFRDFFPVFVIDMSKQVERVKHSLSEVTIEARFSAAVPANTRAYAVLISDKFMKLESDGHRMVLIQK